MKDSINAQKEAMLMKQREEADRLKMEKREQ